MNYTAANTKFSSWICIQIIKLFTHFTQEIAFPPLSLWSQAQVQKQEASTAYILIDNM